MEIGYKEALERLAEQDERRERNGLMRERYGRNNRDESDELIKQEREMRERCNREMYEAMGPEYDPDAFAMFP